MRLAARLAREFPGTRAIMHNFDGVCFPKIWLSDGEFGVMDVLVTNPLQKDWGVHATDMSLQFTQRSCVSVRSFLAGEPVAILARSFGHTGFSKAMNSLKSSDGFKWYTQSFHREAHTAIEDAHHKEAIKHLQTAFAGLPSKCGA